MTTQTKTRAQEKRPAVLEAVPTTALDSPAGAGPIAIFYGAARYPFELARQRELVEDYAEAMGLNLVTEFHDRHKRQHGLSMLLETCQRGGVDYVITAGWPPPNLPPTEAQPVLEQLAASGIHLVCLNAWHPGDGTLPAWWNDEEGAQIRQLDALRDEERQQREQTGETGESDHVGESGQPSGVNQAGEAVDGTDARETSKAGDTRQASAASTTSQAIEPTKEVHHA